MKKYSEITLTDEEKKILEYFKSQEYTDVLRKEDYDRIAFYDGTSGTEYMTSIRNMFDFIDTNEHYEIEKLLNPPHEPKSVWELEFGDRYYYINCDGDIIPSAWTDSDFGNGIRSQGNAFLTEEEAEAELEVRKKKAQALKPKPILDDAEKRYLSAVIKPFRDDVIFIQKCTGCDVDYECIDIEIKSSIYIDGDYIVLPAYVKGTMYTGMESDKKYTLEELGL